MRTFKEGKLWLKAIVTNKNQKYVIQDTWNAIIERSAECIKERTQFV